MAANSYSGMLCPSSTLSTDGTGGGGSLGTSLTQTNASSITSTVGSDLLFSAVSGVNFTSQVFYGSLNEGTQRSAIANNGAALDGPSMWAADFNMGVAPDTELQVMFASRPVLFGGAAVAVKPTTTVTATSTATATATSTATGATSTATSTATATATTTATPVAITWQAETHTSPAAASTTGGSIVLPSAYATAGNATLLSVAISDDSTPTTTATTVATATATSTATTGVTSTATTAATTTATATATTTAVASATSAPTSTAAIPACVLVTHGIPFPTPFPNGGNITNPGVTLEQPPNLPTANQTLPLTAPSNDICCSIVYPPFICDYHSATCYYVNPPFVHTGEP